MNLLQITKMIGSAFTATIVSAIVFGGVSGAASSSKIVQYGSEAQYNTVLEVNVADVLRSKGDTILKPFERLVTKLSRADKTTCDVESEVRLISVCRSLDSGGVNDVHTAEILDAVRSLYGIRKAICETGLSGSQIPYPCNNLLPLSTPELSRQRMAQSELELVRTGNIPACLRKFQTQHYLWTSYSNNRQDANDMIHLLRSDIEMQSVIMTYRDFEESMNGFREVFDKIRTGAAVWYEEADQRAQDLLDKQDKTFVQFEQGFSNVSIEVLQKFDRISSEIESGYGVVSQLSSLAVNELSQVIKDTSIIHSGIASIKNAMTELYTGAANEVVVATKSQTHAIGKALELLAEKTSALEKSLGGLETLPDLTQLSSQLDEVHARNLGQLHEQFALSTKTFDVQLAIRNASKEALETVQQTLAGISSLHSSVTTLAKLVEVFFQYECVFVTIGRYIALSLVLLPLEVTVIPRKVVSNIKMLFLASQAGIFILQQLDLAGRLVSAQQATKIMVRVSPTLDPVIWVVLTLAIFGVALASKRYIRSRCKSVKNSDVEEAVPKEFKTINRELRMCDRQRQRFESISRNARYSSTPPGL